MNWFETYPKTQEPTLEQIESFIASPLWNGLCSWAEGAYAVAPKVEYSTCSGAPGWNVKYKKSGRALCTLYPDAGQFIALVTIGAKEATEAELLLPTCTEYLRELYARTQTFNGARWLMIHVTDEGVLEDVKKLIRLRVAPKEKK
ncbi:MAG: hypothetical protein CVV04_10005 [Firmicutes bacterium HGW-Firmicutes-9]|jgi:hypothetical protein|nr:MAG: hypothetical protein CVV04_10005 [Firmicutes bacterium HGW-Firmicutes-9]